MKASMRRQGEPPPALGLLINHGADVNAKDLRGRSALWFAVENGNIQTVKLLLAAHADVNVRDRQGRSISDIATNKQIADLLLAAKK